MCVWFARRPTRQAKSGEEIQIRASPHTFRLQTASVQPTRSAPGILHPVKWLAGRGVARACTGGASVYWIGSAISSRTRHTPLKLLMFRTLNELFNGFRAFARKDRPPKLVRCIVDVCVVCPPTDLNLHEWCLCQAQLSRIGHESNNYSNNE